MINGAAYHRHIVQTQMKQWKIELHIVSTTRDTLQRDQKVNRALREVYKLSLFVIKVWLRYLLVIRLPNLLQILAMVSFLAAFGDS